MVYLLTYYVLVTLCMWPFPRSTLRGLVTFKPVLLRPGFEHPTVRMLGTCTTMVIWPPRGRSIVALQCNTKRLKKQRDLIWNKTKQNINYNIDLQCIIDYSIYNDHIQMYWRLLFYQNHETNKQKLKLSFQQWQFPLMTVNKCTKSLVYQYIRVFQPYRGSNRFLE